MIFRKLIGSANVIHVQCQNCLPTYEMQIAQKIRNKSQNVKLPRVFGYGPAGRMLHLPTFIPNIEVNVAEKYELYRPQWFYEHVKGGISKKEIYKKFRRVLWLDNDSGKVYTDHQIRRRQQQKIVFFKHLLSQDKQLTLVFRPHPVWSKTDLKELDLFGSIEDRFELDITGKSIESVLQDFDLVLVTYSTAVFEVIASHVAVIFISIDEDVMAEAWSEELKLPLIKIPSENQVTLEEIQARSPEYDEIFKKQFERFLAMKKMIKLDFVVVGFPKCGTTSLCKLLGNHKDISIPTEKETVIFLAIFHMDWSGCNENIRKSVKYTVKPAIIIYIKKLLSNVL